MMIETVGLAPFRRSGKVKARSSRPTVNGKTV